MLTTERMNQITTEETLGLEHGTDSDEEQAFRAAVKLDIAKIKEDGHEVQVPNE